ncbi:MAG: AAA family ATPase [Lachnospiraceae bacterium]|nr:AAA family ATPase [Lachnospiraceae bacterium]
MNKSDFKQYEPGVFLEKAFPDDKIPLLQMLHLRMLDYLISRGISYERTVDDFMLQLHTNHSLRCLRERDNMVILLNEEGALIKEKGKWTLLFTPEKEEKLTLSEDAPLYPVLKKLYNDEKDGTVCRINVPHRSLRTLISGMAPFSILDEYCKTQPGSYLSVAEQIVYQGNEVLLKHVPVIRYGNLVTADKEEIEKYYSIKSLLDDYIFQYDHRENDSTLQPLSIAVFGPPGCGKSFGVKQIAKSCGRFFMSSINLSQYNSPVEMFDALRGMLQYQNNSIPLIFFDEFDSELAGTSRGWLKYFLAPMQDGEYTLNGRVCSISGAVFVFAGATAASFKEFLPNSPEAEEQFRLVKGVDFVSRLKGTLNIKGPNPRELTDRSYIIRRAMLFHDQIISKFPGICNNGEGPVSISRGLLSALLRVSEYRHGTRSIELLLAMSRLSDVTRFTPSCLPVDDQLDIHLDVEDFKNKLNFEQMMGGMVDKYSEIAHEQYRNKHLEDAKRQGCSDEELSIIMKEPEMADWSSLDELFKSGHRSQIRYVGEKLLSYGMSIGLRPIIPGATDNITELFGPVLEELATLEHERWVRDKLAEGWHYGKSLNADLKSSPELVPYDELDASTQDMIRLYVRNMPIYLQKMGYELYKKSY